jgi:hypothetical protein
MLFAFFAKEWETTKINQTFKRSSSVSSPKILTSRVNGRTNEPNQADPP